MGAMGVAGTVVGLEAVVKVLEKLDGTFQCQFNIVHRGQQPFQDH